MTGDSELPRILVCEDGDEYTDRFTRFLGRRFAFVRARSFREARQLLAEQKTFVALVLDLDFRRTPVSLLLSSDLCEGVVNDVHGAAADQGILLLRGLRRLGVTLPALLCADLDDPIRERLLCAELGPLQLVPSSEGLHELAARLP